ncbi:hypothetical protein RRG08_055199 [Elysia crispata]|uniref:Ig-like domain-containing protein n=1 Tax=Elysia crispata TaxID=231223 RepID=A0AAE0YW85_9GAST|nr:hypothetical protein RRG08_055199 [Elysia crispata]
MLDTSRASMWSCERSSAGKSILTINSVSRTDPFNMEVKWTCDTCVGSKITVCEKLEVYAPPESPSCTMREDTESGDIKSVTVSCSTSKVYPKARCRFYRVKDGSNPVEIPTNPVYSHTPTGDPAKVTGTLADKTVTLSFSQASHSCFPEAVQGYFLEESTTCTCSLSSAGHPRGRAHWYKGGQQVGSSKTLVVTRDKNNLEHIYKCKAVSDLGQKVTCRVTNTVLNTWQDKETTITFRKPPHALPQMTVDSKSYQGVNPSNIVTLTEGYSGDVTCRVEGGYPAAHTTQLKCGQLVDTGAGHTAALSFQADQLTREMNGAVCTCTSQHDSGCYSNNETQLTINVLYAPEVTFTLDPAQTTFIKGDNLELKCSGQGNPDPTLTLTTKETTDNLSNVQTTELIHTLIVDCMDTGVYVCSGQNSQGTNGKEISISVDCPQQLSPLFNSKPQVDAAIRETAKFGIEIYGFPQPRTLTLERTNNDIILTYSPRHSLEYIAGVAPFGVVNVTIFDLVEADYVNYTLTVDNGVGNALVYTFYLDQVDAGGPEESIVNKEDSLNISSIVIGVIAAVTITCLIVVVIFVVKKNRGLKKERLDSQYKNTKQSNPQRLKNDDYLVPLEMSTSTSHVSNSVPPKPRQYETINDIPSTTNITPVSARTAQYETIQDMATTSRTYNSTSRQDVEPMSVYHDLEPNHLTSGDLGSCGPYSNVPGQHGENLGNPAINYAYVDMSSLKGNSQNKKVTKQDYQNVEMK